MKRLFLAAIPFFLPLLNLHAGENLLNKEELSNGIKASFEKNSDLNSTKEWDRGNGQKVIFNPKTLNARRWQGLKMKKPGRYFTYDYILRDANGSSNIHNVRAYCERFRGQTSEDDGDLYVLSQKHLQMFKRQKTYAKQEAVVILQRYCPEFTSIRQRTEIAYRNKYQNNQNNSYENNDKINSSSFTISEGSSSSDCSEGRKNYIYTYQAGGGFLRRRTTKTVNLECLTSLEMAQIKTGIADLNKLKKQANSAQLASALKLLGNAIHTSTMRRTINGLQYQAGMNRGPTLLTPSHGVHTPRMTQFNSW